MIPWVDVTKDADTPSDDAIDGAHDNAPAVDGSENDAVAAADVGGGDDGGEYLDAVAVDDVGADARPLKSIPRVRTMQAFSPVEEGAFSDLCGSCRTARIPARTEYLQHRQTSG